MAQPGWKGSLRVAGLFMAGIFVGGLGAGIARDGFLLTALLMKVAMLEPL